MEASEIVDLADGIKSGDRKAIAQAITLMESIKADDHAIAEALLEQLGTANESSIRIGISGTPGVGKSTFIEALGQLILKEGNQLAILAVDPTSSISGGSILADKTRMASLSRDKNVFIRPSPSGDNLGGVNRSTRESIAIVEAAGFNVTLVETVGVGQSETEVFEMTDIFIVLLNPGGGDELQGIKRGITELSDIIVVNKSDGDLESSSKSTVLDYKNALKLMKPRIKDWSVPIIACSALEKTGLEKCWESIQNLQELLLTSRQLESNRNQQKEKWLIKETRQGLLDALDEDEEIQNKLKTMQEKISEENRSVKAEAKNIIANFLSKLRNNK
ncbi:MAG: methylmalonyl Co-A mutase-associated GTPase MeaB [Candidatus Marinimicrobia bacterium]|nr:methylmalonyl Co-A mutase-associated GTPase MeaB [Candidatus Neomarinimicrobiota bacterium]